MTNKIGAFFMIGVALTALFSCEKIIHPDLQSIEPIYVIQGRMSNFNDTWSVTISRTRDFFSNTDAPFISEAVVNISDEDGNTEPLFHSKNGIYLSQGPKMGIVGKTYTLNVLVDGKNFRASEKITEQLLLDSIAVRYMPKIGFFKEGYYLFMYGLERPGKGDFYLNNFYINDTLIDRFGFLLTADDFIDGNYIASSFPFVLKSNDSVVLDQFTLNKSYYDYLIEVQTQASRSGSPFDAPPANPKGNISNGAMGYFSAVNKQRWATKVP